MKVSARSFKSASLPAASSEAFRTYGDYARLLIRSALGLNTLLRYGRTLDLAEAAARLEKTLKHLEEGAFSIAVVGEFKRGKSTVINALLGSLALPTDAMPATATVTRVVYGREPEAMLHMRDGRREAVAISELDKHITKIDDEAAARAAEVEEAIVAYPTLFCQNNVEIIDTPGLSDEKAMTRLTLDIIPKTDAAIFVVSALSPFGQSEAAFLEQLMTTIDPGRIFFVLTHVDRLKDPRDVKRLTKAVRQRVFAAIKAARPGEGAAPRLPLRLFAVSAWQALEGKVRRDNELYETSLFPELERALEDYLARDRGAAALAQVTQVLREASAIQLGSLDERMKQAEHRETLQVQRFQVRNLELDGIIASMGEHLADLETRSRDCENHVRQTVVREYQRLQTAIQSTLGDLSFRDEHLSDSDARIELVRSALMQVATPIVDELCRTLTSIIAGWSHAEDAALGAINERLDRALADRETEASNSTSLPTRTTGDGQPSTTLALVNQGLFEPRALAKQFRDGFQPAAGLVTEQTLGIAGRMLDSKSVKEGYRAVRGIFQPDGARRAEAQMRETRDQIRERLRRAYISETRKHIATLFTELGIENKSVAAVRSLADGISAMLDREQDYVTKLAEWRQVELKIERARRQATNAHEREELEAMQAETREIAAEAQRHAELLSLALGSGDETCTTAE